MPLSDGTRLGSYQILSALGAGGMGEVYRARDTRLDRDVAIKILPEAFAADADRVSRFQREAKVLASLNHPHIAAIYGLEGAEGVKALVMELVEGEDLAQRLARGAVPLDEALPIAKQIAEALEAAHEQDIIHRDLKPANVKVRSDGTVKVLDFGLAKAFNPTGSPSSNATMSPTISMHATQAGVLLGTAAYMPPEQAKGKSVDRRADLWSFGCVLYEMLAGHRPFVGETISDVLAKIIERDPDWNALPAKTPRSLRTLLHRCLEKDPRRRLDSAAVARLEIDEARREPTPVVEAAGARRGRVWQPIVWAATGAGVAVLVTTIFAGRVRPQPPSAFMATSFVFDRTRPAWGTPGVHFAVSPSGKTLVFAGAYGGNTVLYRRHLDRVDPEPIVGTEGGSDVFFSPDGRRIAFEKLSALWTVSVDGGTPQMLLPNQPLRGGTWGEGDRMVIGRVGSGLWMVSSTGGEPRQLTVPKQGERHELPQMLPGGRAVLFTILADDKPSRAAVHVLETGETRLLLEGIGARFLSAGYVVFGLQERLWAVAFNPESLQTLGAARPVRDDVLWSGQGYPQFAIDAGLLVYAPRSQAFSNQGDSVLAWMDRQGRRDALPLKPNNFGLPRLSPAGDRVVIKIGYASGDLWTYDFRRGTLTKLTSDRIVASSAPAWTPDGSRVAFPTWFDGEVGLGWLHPDGSGQVEELIKGNGMRSFEYTNPAMMPDGSGLIMTGLAPGATVEDLLYVPLNKPRRLETLFQAAGVERNPAIAPSGRFIAYNSDESGRDEVYVRPLPDAGSRKWQISTDSGAGPSWTRGGSEIVYEDSQGRMMAVGVRSDGKEPDFSTPKELFKVAADDGFFRGRNWDVTADGERFLFVVSGSAPERTGTSQLILIQNWDAELQRLARRESR